MPRIRVLSGKDVCEILASHGFTEVRRRGSHIIMQRVETGSTTTIPIPDHREWRTGTVMSIIRQSGLSRSLFE